MQHLAGGGGPPGGRVVDGDAEVHLDVLLQAVDDLDLALAVQWFGDGDDAIALDTAMDAIQLKLTALGEAIHDELFVGKH